MRHMKVLFVFLALCAASLVDPTAANGYPGGQTKFSCCPAGNYAVSCQSCPAGTYSPSSSAGCIKCPAGHFSSSPGSRVCSRCPDGLYAPVEGSTVCSKCPYGSIATSPDRTKCYKFGECYFSDKNFVSTSVTHTKSSKPCQSWTVTSCSEDTNGRFCHVPKSIVKNAQRTGNTCRRFVEQGEVSTKPWCYTTTSTRWEYCDIPLCGPHNPQTEAKSLGFIKHPGSLALDATVSSNIINLPKASRFDCLAECKWRGCAAVVTVETSGFCQLVMVNDASAAVGPPDSHVRRLLGSEAGATVWKVEGFERLLEERRAKFRRVFKNSGTGRKGFTQHQIIHVTGCYRIEVSGAKGGGNAFRKIKGGNGALVRGDFNLKAGTQLAIVVGQAGGSVKSQNAGGGGGGGSFVYRTADRTLLAAAGGGGGTSCYYNGIPGQASTKGSDSVDWNAKYNGVGGTNGKPGFNDPAATFNYPYEGHGGCGAGWLGKAINPRRGSRDGGRGGSLADGWVGGRAGDANTDSSGGVGGFGGGGGGGAGGGATHHYGAGGGGGGFSGGAAGVAATFKGGGGGSLCSGSGCNAITGGGNDNDDPHGRVELQLLAPFAANCK